MDLFNALKTRRAVRSYSGTTLERGEIEALIDAAVSAPSAMNLQPWAFAVVDDGARLQALSQQVKPYVLEHLPPNSPLAAHLADPHFEIFHGAPALIVICARDSGPQSAEDCCLAGQNLMLAAHASGLGSCWIGLSRPWLNLPVVKEELGIPAEFVPVAPIIVGHGREIPPPTPRERPRVIWCG